MENKKLLVNTLLMSKDFIKLIEKRLKEEKINFEKTPIEKGAKVYSFFVPGVDYKKAKKSIPVLSI